MEKYDRYEEEIDLAIKASQQSRGFGWGLVRVLGELQVLTRASYIVLIVVPLIAGIWPSFTSVVNRYNDSIETASQRLELAVNRVEVLHKEVNTLNISPVVSDFSEQIKIDLGKLRDSLDSAAFDTPLMPIIWVWAFFSALATIIAHTIYQLGAPQNIQRASERDFINEVIDEELKYNPDLNRSRDSNRTSEKSMQHIALSARDDYIYSHKSRKWLAIITSGFYVAAVSMILIVIFLQARSVLAASDVF